MKTKIALLLVVVLIATFASAREKYVSTEFGFSASYPADVRINDVRTDVASDVVSFIADAPGGAWEAQVKVFNHVAMPNKITKKVMDAKFAEIFNNGYIVQKSVSSYTTFQGHPALLATATFIIDRKDTGHVGYAVVVDLKLIFVKNQGRIYLVSGMAIDGMDRSGIQSFLDSFELVRQPWPVP